MQHIVTRSDYEAKELIKLLRSNQAGRATFLPINAIKGRYLKDSEKHVLDMPGCIGVAADLIDFDDKFYDIAYSLMGRTVICDNMDSAVRLAKEVRYSCRFVTLKGDVVNPGGSMSGGSKNSKEYSPIARRSRLEELTELSVVAKKDANQALIKLDELHKQMENQRADMDRDNNLLNEMRIDYAREKERFDKLIASTLSNDEKLSETQAQIARISENIEDAKKEIEEIGSASEDAVKKDTISREEITKSQAQVNDMRENHDQMQQHLQELISLGAADEKERATASEKILWLESEAKRLTNLIEDKKRQHAKNQEMSEAQANELSSSKTSVDDQKTQLENLQTQLGDKVTAYEEEKNRLNSIQDLMTVSQTRQMELSDKKHSIQLKLERGTLELEQIQNRMWDYYELTYQGMLEYKNNELDMEGADEDIERMRRQIKAMGTVNVNAVQDFAELNERYTEHKLQHDDLIKAENDLLSVIDGLNKQMRERFVTEFKILNDYFSENFTKLFGGGRAHLTLSDEEDVLNSGIIIEAQPPGKKLQMLSLLSGGEKALTATAILFAFLKHRPSPFCLLDEIETALDDANLHHFTDFLKQYADDTQFVVITHRRPTMESCDILYGVTMEEKGVSKMVSVRIADYK